MTGDSNTDESIEETDVLTIGILLLVSRLGSVLESFLGNMTWGLPLVGVSLEYWLAESVLGCRVPRIEDIPWTSEGDTS